MILLLSLCSPIAELFPDLYMSWWLPTNGRIQTYLRAWPRRILIVLTVWGPILFTLGVITSLPIQLIISFMVFTSFGLRLYFFDRILHKVKNNTTDLIEPSIIPEVIYFVAFISIGFVLYFTIPSMQWLVPMGILLIFIGANMMGRFRTGANKNLNWDVLGRLIFTIGFSINLYNLAKAASVI